MYGAVIRHVVSATLLLSAALWAQPPQEEDVGAATAAPPAAPVLFDFSAPELAPARLVPRRDGRRVWLRELYSLRREEDFRIAAFLGFNAVIGDAAAEAPGLFALARVHDFAVTEANWWGAASLDDAMRAELARYMEEPALVAINLNDEPDLRQQWAPPANIAALSRDIRAAWPTARSSVTLAGTSPGGTDTWPAYADAVDILRVDPYPLVYGKPLRHVYDLVRAGRAAAGPDKPVICVLQGWIYGDTPLPTAAELRAMLYMALIAGADGYSIFDWNLETWSRSPEFVRALMRLNTELDFITDSRDSDLTLYMQPPILHDGIVATTLLWRPPPRSPDASAQLRQFMDQAGRPTTVPVPADLVDQEHVLLVNTNESGPPRRIRLRLPRALIPELMPWERMQHVPPPRGPYYSRVDGSTGAWTLHPMRPADGSTLAANEVELTLAPLETVWIVGGRRLPFPLAAPTVWPLEQDTSPVPAGRYLPVDLAGRWLDRDPPDGDWLHAGILYRLVTPSARDAVHPEIRAENAFRAAGGRLHIDSPYQLDGVVNQVARRARIYPGGDLAFTLDASVTHGQFLGIEPLSWHDTRSHITGDALADFVSLQPLADTPGRVTLRVHLPPDRDWSRDRDQLLTLRLTWRDVPGQRHRVDHVLRFCVEDPYLAEWTWTAAAGELRLTPTFPPSAYPPAHARDLALFAHGLTITTTPLPVPPGASTHAWRADLSLAPDATDTRDPIDLHARISHHAIPCVTLPIANLHIAAGQILPPTAPRRATAFPLPAPPSPDADFPSRWAERAHQPPTIQHLLDTPDRFAGPTHGHPADHRAWISYDPTQLHIYLDIARYWTGIRAEATGHDPRWGGDDLALLILRPLPDSGATYLLQLNPAGITADIRLDAPPGRAWSPALHTHTQRLDDGSRWQAIISIPWADLDLTGPPPADRPLRLNLAILQSTAPRNIVTWCPGSDPDQPTFVAPLHLQPPAAPAETPDRHEK